MNDTLGQPGSDSLYSFLSKCLNDEQAKDIQAKFNQNGIEYGDLLQLPEKYINETLKELKVKPWHIGPIVNQLSKIEGSAVYQNSSRSSVVVLPTKQNEYVLALHKNTEIIKENIAKLLETENQINANSKTIISDIDKYYNNLTNILAKQKEKTLKKLDTIKNNKLKIIKQETVKANQALDCLTGANDKLNKIIVDNKLDLTKKQIAVTKHIEAAQKATVTHQPYLKPNMPLKTGPKMKYQPKQQILFEKYVLNMDDVIDNDIDFTNIKFDYDKAKIEWKCDLLALNKDIKFDLQFKNKKSSVDDDEKVQQNEWKSLTELKAKQIAVYLDPDADKDEKLQDNDDDEKSVNNQDGIEFYGDSDDSDDSDDDNDGTIKKKQKTTIGLLTELTSYRFRIAVQSSLNNIYSQILTKKTPKFIMPKFKSNMINTAEYVRLMKWIPGSAYCKFKLLFKGTRDGFAASTFHSKCDNKGPTLTIIKSSNNHIFGGYSEKAWNSSGGYQKDDSAWLYLLRSSKGDKPQVFEVKPGDSNALYFNSGYGPTYGNGHNLHLANNCNQNTSSYARSGYAYQSITNHSQLAGSNSFKVTDYEVWEICDFGLKSTIITNKEYQRLNKWIKASSPDKYKLLFRASRDGFAASTFHSKCDNRGPMVTIIKSTNNHIFGGYSHISWTSRNTYQKDDDAWLYLLKSAKGDKPQRFKAKPGSNALYCHSGYGPTYGDGHNLYLPNNCNSSNASCNAQYAYPSIRDANQLAGASSFKVTDYEVWAISDGSIPSAIITKKEYQQLNEWIKASTPYQYKLLLRGSTDGFAASTFHSKCDNKGTTLTIVKSNHNHIFGGYAEKSWDQKIANYVKDDNAWLYLLKSTKGDKPQIFKAKPGSNALYFYSSYGPTYGDGHNLYLANNCNQNTSSYCYHQHAYPSIKDRNQLAGSANFKVTDYEVWQINVSKINSTILQGPEFQILNEWVLASGKSQYKLLFRASRDGFASSAFHSKCDDQGTTLVVAQSEHNHVFGGYTEASWKYVNGNYTHNNTAKAWIYLLRSSKNDQPEKWTPTKKPQNAIYPYDSFGPTFGGGHDLCLYGDCNINKSSYSNLGHSYSTDLNTTKLAGAYNYKVTDYEVWHVF